MERYTKEQRVVIVKTHYKYGESYAGTVRKVSSYAMAIRIGHRGRAI
jgi:chlorite dismutase